MDRSLVQLRPHSRELLNNIAVVRRLQETNAEESLYEDWKRLVRWLQSELPRRCPALLNWARPTVDIDADPGVSSVTILPDASWTFDGQRAVGLCFTIFSESVYDDDCAPNVSLWINSDWEHAEDLRALLQTTGRPAGFTSTNSDGTTDPDCPFWKSLPLRDFLREGAFDLDRFVNEIAVAFVSLAPVRSVVDSYLAEHLPAHSPVPPLRKALILDLETWGQGKPDEDEIVEVGLILTAYDSRSGELAGVLDRYEGLRDPGRQASGIAPGRITRRMVAGRG